MVINFFLGVIAGVVANFIYDKVKTAWAKAHQVVLERGR